MSDMSVAQWDEGYERGYADAEKERPARWRWFLFGAMTASLAWWLA